MLDPRGPRFTAAITTVVFILVLAFGSAWLALAQAAVFALTAFTRYGPYTLLYKRFVAPRLNPPGELEAPQPVRFAQIVGLIFALLSFTGYQSGAPILGMTAAGFALAAAFLNAAFGFCLGCEVYLLLRRWVSRTPSTDVHQ
ncbi:MAG TPA: DUF4395 domain-containing protein [Candidatus Limnocylindrales bacterium]|nr:DUF4395 domain-containing protein [Candidatus Limnocylindrales bacterium]